jgi:tetratricopeptide (TPR) repeat protein
VYAISGRDVAAVGNDPTSAALAVGAGEVLVLQVHATGRQLGGVDASLLDASGATLWTDEFAVPDDAPLLAAEAARLRVRSAFPGRRMRWKPGRAVSPELFSQLLTLRAQIQSGAVTYEEALETARRLRGRAGCPEEAARIEVLLASYLFRSLGDRRYLEDARDALGALKSIELDPRAVVARADFALASRDLGSLREANLSLESLAPQHPYLARFRARAEELAGRPDAGVQILREAIDRVPRWFDLLALADLELRCGQPLLARKHLEAAGQLAPQVAQITTKRCEVELTYGSPVTAERLLLKMISKLPQGHYSVNLGIAKLLQLKVDGAQKEFRTARSLGCRLALLRVYEADVTLLQGRFDEASELFLTAIKELQEPTRAPDPFERLNLAYCQARAGSCGPAIQTLRGALTSVEASPHVAYSAMMIYRLCDDEAEAARYEEIARRDGLSEPWFKLAGALLAATHRGAGGT